MPRRMKCCVRNCENSRQDATKFKFPVNEKRLKKWLMCLSSVCDTENINPRVDVVCCKHFQSRFITSKGRLLCDAYPSIFLEAQSDEGATPIDSDLPVLHREHNYSRKRHHDHTYSKLETNKGTPTVSTPLQPIASVSGISNSPHHIIPESAMVSEMQFKTRIVGKTSLLTSESKKIYLAYKKTKAQLNYRKRSKLAEKLRKEDSFEKLTKNMNPWAKKFLKMQIKMCGKNKHGRRFTTEEKMIALSIQKQSPKCYRFLSKIFALPSKSTLNAMIAKLNIGPGINGQVMNLFKKEVDKWDNKKKLCSIIFDEMSLETALTYNKNKDNVLGFVDVLEKTCEYADHALVFMLKGAVYKWQQPIAYYYCQGATSATELKKILKSVVDAVIKIGLKPITLICDQGAAFQSAINNMTEETRRSQILNNEHPDGAITIKGVKLFIIYDPSHLIKGLRNNFLTKNITLDGKISTWQDIVDVYLTDCHHTETRLLHKLNDQCVMPEKIKKMKVRNCVRVLSRTMSAALAYTANFSHYVDGRPVSKTLKNTSETVSFLDSLFDSINGAATSGQKTKGKELRKAVTKDSKHHEFWKQAITTLEKIKFIDNKGIVRSVPSIKKFITTIKSFERLWQFFKEKDIKIMRPRYFNSDAIENFFGQVRAYNYRSNNPDCHNFSCTFKSLLITRLIKFHSDSFNCEDDSAEQAINLNTLFEKHENVQSHPSSNININNVLQQARRERINTHSRAYTAGWVVKKILMKINCNECQENLTSSVSLDIHDWIGHREYTKAQKKRLNYPSEGAVRCFSTIISETNEYLESNAHRNNLSYNVKEILLSKYSFDFINCAEHRDYILDYFIRVTVKFTIVNWCNIINKILKGTDIIRLQRRNDLPKMQKKALEKYTKKLKNKSLNK